MPSAILSVRLTVDNLTWVPVTVPLNDAATAYQWAVIANPSSQNLKRRTDSSDSTTERLIRPGYEWVIHVEPNLFLRFRDEPIICYLQAASGTFDAVVDFY